MRHLSPSHLLGLLCGILCVLARPSPILAGANGPLGTQLAQIQRQIVSMVRDPVRPIIYATTTLNSVIAINTTNTINTSSMTMSELTIGSNPAGLDVSADGSRLYVANSGSTTAGVGVVDLTTFTTLPSLPAPFPPTSIAAGLNGHLYLLCPQGSAITQIDSTTGAVQASLGGSTIGIDSGKLQCSPDRKTLYYGNFDSSALYVLDVSGATPVLEPQAASGAFGDSGKDLILSADGSTLVFVNGAGQGGYGVYLFPTANLNTALGTFDTGYFPDNGAFSPDGTQFYTSPDTENQVQVWSTSTFTEIGSFPITNIGEYQQVGTLLTDASGQYLFVSTETQSFGSPGVLTVYTTGAGVYPLITSPSTVNFAAGSPGSFTLTSNLANATWSATGLPSGLTIGAASGIISGTAASAGVSSVKVTAKGPSGSATATLSLTVQKIPATIVTAGTKITEIDRPIVELIRDPARPMIYATTGNNTVLAINTATLLVTAEIWIGSNPAGLDISPDGTRLYVANSGSTTAGIGIVDLTTFQALPSLPTPFQVESLAAGLNGHLYILGPTLDQIDSATGAVQATVSTQTVPVYSGKLVTSLDRETLYYGNFGESPSALYALDISGSAPVVKQSSAFNSTGSNGEDLVLTPDGSALVFPNGGGQGGNYGINLIPTSNLNSALGNFPVGAYPYNGAFGPDGSIFYTAPNSQNIMQIWNTGTFLKIGSFTVPALDHLLLDSLGKYIFATTDTESTGTASSLMIYSTGTRLLPTITSAATLNVHEGAPINFTFAAKESNVTWNATNLPVGLNLDPQTGILTGSVAKPGNYAVGITASDQTGGVSQETFNLVVQTAFTVQLNGPGTLTGGSAGTTFVALGSAYSLTANAAANYLTTGWAGSAAASGATISGSVTADMTLTANIVPATTLSVAVSGPGVVTTGFAGTTTRVLGSTVTIVAAPTVGNRFTGWTGDVTSFQPSLTLTLSQPTSLTATFGAIVLPKMTSPATATVNAGAPLSYTLTAVESNVTWSATGLPPELTLDAQTGAITGAEPTAGNYIMKIQSTDQYGTSAQSTLTISVLTTVTLQINGQGSITGGSPGATWAAIGSAYTYTAVPAAGSMFTGWTGGETSSVSTLIGNVTAGLTLAANFVPAAALNVTVSGPGTVTANLAGATQQPIGSSVTIQATPAAGAEFLGWTGDLTSTQSALTYTVAQAENLTANFAAVTSVTGSYVFAPAAGATVPPGPLTSLTATISATSALTGKLAYAGQTYVFKVSFPPATGYTVTLTGQGGHSIGLQITLSMASGHAVLTATLTDGAITLPLTGYRLEKVAAGQVAAHLGRYTFLLPPIAGTTAAGYGHGLATVTKTGAMNFLGVFGDGTAFSSGAQLTDSGTALLNTTLYNKKGYLTGFLQFRDQPGQSDFDGPVVWSQPVHNGAAVQANALQTNVQVLGSAFTPPAAGANLFAFTSGQVTFANGGLATPVKTTVTLGAKNKLASMAPDPNALTCALNTTTGAFTGTFALPGSKARHAFSGVVFLKNPSAAGCFKGNGTAGYGAVELTP